MFSRRNSDNKLDSQGEASYTKGTCEWQDGKKYFGQFVENKKCGMGIAIYKKSDLYIGEWKDNKYQGMGIYFHIKTDTFYIGEWKNGEMNGKGTYKDAEGNQYRGEWLDNKRHGNGISIKAVDGSKYETTWVKGELEYYNSEYPLAMDKSDDIYKTPFANSDKDLRICRYRNQDLFIGEFKNNKRNGYGIKTLLGNYFLIGKWENNNLCSKFILMNYTDGNIIFDGKHKNYKRVEGFLYHRDGTKEELKKDFSKPNPNQKNIGNPKLDQSNSSATFKNSSSGR
jgi:hypothetical protein